MDLDDNLTPMHHAVNDPELLEILISYGASVRAAEDNSISLVTLLSSEIGDLKN